VVVRETSKTSTWFAAVVKKTSSLADPVMEVALPGVSWVSLESHARSSEVYQIWEVSGEEKQE